MLIGFLGDMHGLVFHAIAAVTQWQVETGKRFDLIIQVGDLGAYPDPARMDAASRRYLTVDPAQADFSRLLSAQGARGELLRRLRGQLPGPICFLRGNHEDFAWLSSLPIDANSRTAAVDSFDLFRYVPDGTLLRYTDCTIAFLGGVEEQEGPAGIDFSAYQSLLDLGPGVVDVLVSHEGPYGSSIGFRGDTHGSQLMTRLLEQLKPAFHIAGHAHQLVGPRRFEATTYLGLDCLVASVLWNPEARGLQPGCLGVLDTATATLQPVTDNWLTAFERDFEFDAWAQTVIAE